MVSRDFRRQLEGYGLTTANILYHLPDHPGILQTYIWQEYDLQPTFPEAHAQLIRPAEFRHVGHEFRLN